mmetsp:Transcript_9794/g.17250  ORF Transcript_9794/g.17250 Transcript_9794/m.17250 type:complete len:207 (+) Transcript_9794:1427-2047(+)
MLARICFHSKVALAISAMITAPLAHAAPSRVPSTDQSSFKSEPAFVRSSRLCVQPVLSQILSTSNAPAANALPFGFHARHVTTCSKGALVKSWRPYESHTRYLQSSPPETIKLLTMFQSTAKIVASCAFQLICFCCFASILSVLPLENKRLSFRPQHTQYTGWRIVATVFRSMPTLDQTLTTPSSPPVAIAVPSGFQATEIAAPAV